MTWMASSSGANLSRRSDGSEPKVRTHRHSGLSRRMNWRNMSTSRKVNPIVVQSLQRALGNLSQSRKELKLISQRLSSLHLSKGESERLHSALTQMSQATSSLADVLKALFLQDSRSTSSGSTESSTPSQGSTT